MAICVSDYWGEFDQPQWELESQDKGAPFQHPYTEHSGRLRFQSLLNYWVRCADPVKPVQIYQRPRTSEIWNIRGPTIFTIIYLSVYVQEWPCHGAGVQVRGQFVGILLSYHVGSKDWTHVMLESTFFPGAISPVLVQTVLRRGCSACITRNLVRVFSFVVVVVLFCVCLWFYSNRLALLTLNTICWAVVAWLIYWYISYFLWLNYFFFKKTSL